MLDFTFYNPTRIFFGRGSVGRIGSQVPVQARVLIVFGAQSARRYGFVDEVKAALVGRQIVEFGGIEPNPDYDTALAGAILARREGVDFLVAVGGGSVIDATKFMAAAIPYEKDPVSLLDDKGANIRRALPLGAVVTLPASGSEMNSRAILSRRSHAFKKAIMNDHLFPRFASLDPEKTFTLPAKYIGNGVVDTFVHVLEQYLTYPAGGHVSDRLAEGLMLSLLDDGPGALADPNNYELRANLMWASTLGLNGLIGAGVPQDWAAHRAGYELTVLYGLDHAETLALLVPAMMNIRRDVKRDKLLQYAERIWGIKSGGEKIRIDAAIEKTRSFFEQMGLPTRIAGYRIDGFSIERVIGLLSLHGLTSLGEHGDVTPDKMRRILECCL